MPSIICSKLFFRTRLLDFGTFPLKEFFSIGTAVGLNFTRTFLCRDFTLLGLISIGTFLFELFPRPLFSFFERWGLFEIHFKSRIFISSRFFETLIFFKLLLQIDFFTSLKFFSLKFENKKTQRLFELPTVTRFAAAILATLGNIHGSAVITYSK